jgi:GNAT superfamily N-acetyltransferase
MQVIMPASPGAPLEPLPRDVHHGCMPDVEAFLPRRATARDWERYHRFRRRRHREHRPDEPVAPDDVAETALQRDDPMTVVSRHLVTARDELIAELLTRRSRPGSPEYETNRHLLWASVHVLEPHRRRGIATSLLPIVLAEMEEHGATVLSAAARAAPGHAFLRHLGAEPRMTERHSRLDLRRVDWGMVDRWVRAGGAASPGARLDLYPQWVPDELLDRYCADLSELQNTIPLEGLDHGDIVVTPESVRASREELARSGSANPTCVVWGADGTLLGVTDVLKHPHEPGIVRQEFTGVRPDARGRGVGKWLKGAMLQHVRRAYPDTVWISTENAASNAPMLSINEALGFRAHVTKTHYQLDREALRRPR